jgi:type VI secretion system secreted protein VgrG
VYNQDNMPPFGLPAGAHKTGFQTRSTPGGGGLCEMVIHDDAGKELINILSQKDMVTTVLNDKSTTVHSNHSTTVNGERQTITVTNGMQDTKVEQQIKVESLTSDIYIKAATAITFEVGASKIVMNMNGNITIEGKHVKVLGLDQVDVNE